MRDLPSTVLIPRMPFYPKALLTRLHCGLKSFCSNQVSHCKIKRSLTHLSKCSVYLLIYALRISMSLCHGHISFYNGQERMLWRFMLVNTIRIGSSPHDCNRLHGRFIILILQISQSHNFHEFHLPGKLDSLYSCACRVQIG